MLEISKKIIDNASIYIGQREIPQNKGFINQSFQKEMEAVGWRPGYAWCMLFCKLIWTKTYKETEYYNNLIRMFNPSVLKTYNNFKKYNIFPVTKEPIPGSIFIMQKYIKKNNDIIPTPFGHAGIISLSFKHELKTIEGNTNIAGSRDGDIIAEKRRLLSFDIKEGLVLKSFINPISV